MLDEFWTTQPEICYNCPYYIEIRQGERECAVPMGFPSVPENCPRMRAEIMNDRRRHGGTTVPPE